MLNYKTYQQGQISSGTNRPGDTNAARHVNIIPDVAAPLKNFNMILRNKLSEELKMELNRIQNTGLYEKRYNIWDVLIENWHRLTDGLMMGATEKLYLIKVIGLLHEKKVPQSGLEYYCLRNIIRFPIFKTQENIYWITQMIVDRLQILGNNNTAIRQCNYFRRNIKKIELVKRISLTPVIYREHWINVYQCCTLCERCYFEVLNQSDIVTSLQLRIKDEGKIQSSIILDTELIDAESDTDIPELNNTQIDDITGLDTIIFNEQQYVMPDDINDVLESQNLDDNNYSPVQSDNDEPINIPDDNDYVTNEADEW